MQLGNSKYESGHTLCHSFIQKFHHVDTSRRRDAVCVRPCVDIKWLSMFNAHSENALYLINI